MDMICAVDHRDKKMNKILACLISFVLALNPTFAFSNDGFVGTWFSCAYKEDDERARVHVMHIKKEGAAYSALLEWGQKYSFNGYGELVKGQLYVKGCNYYVNHLVDSRCDIDNPPLNFKLKQSDLRSKYKNLDKALKNSKWILLDKDLDVFIDKCNALNDELRYDKDGWPVDFYKHF